MVAVVVTILIAATEPLAKVVVVVLLVDVVAAVAVVGVPPCPILNSFGSGFETWCEGDH